MTHLILVRSWGLAARQWLVVLSIAMLSAAAPPGNAQIAVRNQGYIPYSDAPIFYRSQNLSDPVTLLEHKIEQGKVALTYEPDQGYLKSVLKLLEVPADSQTLVFSKTSFQYPKISPEHPRALYFNDDVYVGKVHEGKAIELVSFDPVQGAIFYLLDEREVAKPIFQRAELDCTQCHIAAGTRGIPGVLLRSVYPSEAGTLIPGAPSFITDQESPLKERWGGWFVTGALASASMADSAVIKVPSAGTLGQVSGAERRLSPLEQPFDAASYLEPYSDEVALLVLAHQTQMHNLITLTSYKTRIALYALAQQPGAKQIPSAAEPALDALPESTRDEIERPAEQLVRYLLFVDEASLGGADPQRIIASSAFAREFAARGIRDPLGRSLRDFDLHTRLFRYPCSYLIYASAFDALPEPAKGYVYHRLLEVLTGEDHSPEFAGLSIGSRRAVLEILLATKPALPAEWRAYARSNHLRLATQSSDARRTE